MAKKADVETLFKLLKQKNVSHFIKHFENSRTDYITTILKNGVDDYYDEMQYVAPDDFNTITG